MAIETETRAWLIERPGATKGWWGAGASGARCTEWSTNAMKAVWFVRREDAEAMIVTIKWRMKGLNGVNDLKATEHVFYAKAPEAEISKDIDVKVVDVKCCARCQKCHTLAFVPIPNPTSDFKFWAMCPVTHSPIWLAIGPGDINAELAQVAAQAAAEPENIFHQAAKAIDRDIKKKAEAQSAGSPNLPDHVKPGDPVTAAGFNAILDALQQVMLKLGLTNAGVKEGDMDTDQARAIHRVGRAFHDGECPACGKVVGADSFDLKRMEMGKNIWKGLAERRGKELQEKLAEHNEICGRLNLEISELTRKLKVKGEVCGNFILDREKPDELNAAKVRPLDALCEKEGAMIDGRWLHRSGVVLADAKWSEIIGHLKDEVNELGQDCQRLQHLQDGQVRAKTMLDAAQELADVLGLVVHIALLLSLGPAALAALASEKLDKRITPPPQ